MTNTERLLQALRDHGPLSDAELVVLTGIRPHQQVNQICRRLEAKGAVRRVKRVGESIVNVLADAPGPDRFTRPATSPRQTTQPAPGGSAPAATGIPKGLTGTILLLPCSARKRPGGSRGLKGATIFDLLRAGLGSRLVRARQALKPVAAVNESLLLPAWQRYEGTLYQAADPGISQAIAKGVTVLIVSGGYGLLLGQEPIGIYDRRFRPADWPAGLLAECLTAVTTSVGGHRVLAFCARSTAYVQIVREVPWSQIGVEALVVAPELAGRGGAQVLVPRALGEALRATSAGELTSPWLSSDEVRVVVEPLR